METLRGDSGIPGTNGQVARAIDELGYVAKANTAADRRLIAERIRDLKERVAHFTTSCVDGRALIAASERFRDGLPDHARGWPISLVAVLALVTVLLEWIPASLFTQVFTSANDNVRFLLTVTFTIIGVVLAVVLGELLHRVRAPERPRLIDTVFLIVVATITLLFLIIGYEMRVAYTTASAGAVFGLAAWLEALALTAIAAIGIVLTLISTYYKEALEMFQVRWRLAKLNRDLRTNEAHLKTNKRDLERARASARGDIEEQREQQQEQQREQHDDEVSE